MNTFDAILPAGGRLPLAFAQRVGTEMKTLIEFEGTTILERTLVALRDSGVIGRTVVVGPPEVQNHVACRLATYAVGEGATSPENILRGIAALGENGASPQKVVVITTDLPLVSHSHISRFIDACPPEIDFCIPLVSKASYEERFPDATATFIPLADGDWTAGCAYLIDVEAMKKAIPRIEAVFRNRKSKIGMAKLLGPVFLLKYLMKTLTIPDIEKQIRSMLRCTGVPIPNSPPELAFDIDAEDDWDYLLELQTA